MYIGKSNVSVWCNPLVIHHLIIALKSPLMWKGMIYLREWNSCCQMIANYCWLDACSFIFLLRLPYTNMVYKALRNTSATANLVTSGCYITYTQKKRFKNFLSLRVKKIYHIIIVKSTNKDTGIFLIRMCRSVSKGKK